jgi:hypothetical protein
MLSFLILLKHNMKISKEEILYHWLFLIDLLILKSNLFNYQTSITDKIQTDSHRFEPNSGEAFKY